MDARRLPASVPGQQRGASALDTGLAYRTARDGRPCPPTIVADAHSPASGNPTRYSVGHGDSRVLRPTVVTRVAGKERSDARGHTVAGAPRSVADMDGCVKPRGVHSSDRCL